MSFQALIDKCTHTCFELRFAESLNTVPYKFRTESRFKHLKALDRSSKGIYRWFCEENPSVLFYAAGVMRIANDGFERATFRIRDNWASERLRFDRNDAEIFIAGEKQRSTMSIVLANGFVVNPA